MTWCSRCAKLPLTEAFLELDLVACMVNSLEKLKMFTICTAPNRLRIVRNQVRICWKLRRLCDPKAEEIGRIELGRLITRQHVGLFSEQSLLLRLDQVMSSKIFGRR